MKKKQETKKRERRGGSFLSRINKRFPSLKVLLVLLGVVGGFLGTKGFGWLEQKYEPERKESEKGILERAKRGDEVLERERENNSLTEGGIKGQKDENRDEENKKQKNEEEKAKEPIKNEGKKLVALTFDDGPDKETGRLLDILKKKQVKATFFVLGRQVRRMPDLTRRINNEGHEVESHSYDHKDLSKVSLADLKKDLAEVDAAFQEVLGRKPKMIRPPYGSIGNVMWQNLKLPMILWSVDPMDWKDRNGPLIKARVKKQVQDGGVILLHDIHAATVAVVGEIIDDLRKSGYEFLTVSELAARKSVEIVPGYAYGRFEKHGNGVKGSDGR